MAVIRRRRGHVCAGRTRLAGCAAWARVAAVLAPFGGAAATYVLVVRGALTLDLNLGRRLRPLGPIIEPIAAPRETAFDVIAGPYLGRTPRAMRSKLEVLERGSDMVLAAHFNRVGRLTATTLETVRFERPHRVAFRVLRGPVPYVVETYELRETPAGSELTYSGQLGTDLWRLGQWWGEQVARTWEETVARSLDGIRTEAERRARSRR